MIEDLFEYLADNCVENGSDEESGGEAISFGGKKDEFEVAAVTGESTPTMRATAKAGITSRDLITPQLWRFECQKSQYMHAPEPHDVSLS